MLLLFLILIPCFFGLLSWQSERVNIWAPQWIALFGVSIVFLINLFLWLWNKKYCNFLLLSKFSEIHSSSLWLLEYKCSWIPRFGINLHLALDGLSLLMLVLSGILGLISVLSIWNNNCSNAPGLFYCNLLWVLSGSIGVILAVDMFLFFFFWEITLIPMYFLISLWGYHGSSKKSRINAATKFFIYTQFSGLCILVSILILVFFNYYVNGVWSFDYEDLLHVSLPKNIEYLSMFGFFLAFAIKMPIVPFHTWLPAVHSNSTITGSVDLIGVLFKTSVYGFFRFVLPLFPSASKDFTLFAMFLGIFTIFYGAWMAFVQVDIKRLLAYSSISHMGFILIAIYGNNQLSYQGSIIYMIAYTLSSSGMFILCGQLYERLHTRNLTMIHGLWDRFKLIPAFFLCFILANLGVPGTGNFIGEIIILIGMFQTAPIITIIATLGILFTSIYSLTVIQRMYYSASLHVYDPLTDMTFCEKLIVILLLFYIFVIGFFPQSILDVSYDTMRNICIRLQEYNDLL